MRGADPHSYAVFLGLIVLVVAAGSALVYWLRRDVEEDARPVTDDDLLRDFERAYYAGEMDAAEFRRVSEAIGARKAGVPKPPPPPPTEPGPGLQPEAGPESPAVEEGAGPA